MNTKAREAVKKFAFHFIFNSKYMVVPQIIRSVLQGAMLKNLRDVYIFNCFCTAIAIVFVFKQSYRSSRIELFLLSVKTIVLFEKVSRIK